MIMIMIMIMIIIIIIIIIILLVLFLGCDKLSLILAIFIRRIKNECGIVTFLPILGDPAADKGSVGKSKRAEKYIWNEEK